MPASVEGGLIRHRKSEGFDVVRRLNFARQDTLLYPNIYINIFSQVCNAKTSNRAWVLYS